MTSEAPLTRRRAPRVSLEIQGSLSGRRSSAWSVGILDVSLSGCLVRCPKPLSPGEILDLHLPLGEGSVIAKVQVADSAVDGASPESEPWFLVGMRFFQLPAQDQARLRVFIDAQRRRSPR